MQRRVLLKLVKLFRICKLQILYSPLIRVLSRWRNWEYTNLKMAACVAVMYSLSLTKLTLRYGVSGGPDGRPRPCPVGSWRRSGSHYHLLLAPSCSSLFERNVWTVRSQKDQWEMDKGRTVHSFTGQKRRTMVGGKNRGVHSLISVNRPGAQPACYSPFSWGFNTLYTLKVTAVGQTFLLWTTVLWTSCHFS